MTGCKHFDCGWCYAPEEALTNARNGACTNPGMCPDFSLGLRKGDYVLATKYGDGDPCDHFVIGFLRGVINKSSYLRYDVVDGEWKLFRGNGFRRVEKITPEEGAAMLGIFPLIGDKPGPPVWEHLNRIRQVAGDKATNNNTIADPWFN